ncbi:2-polyprenyl-6-methoxyphenol hydroxylase-like FAD-dependent oxidoreductase [Streptomyces sp. TLI_55]|uniref:FAD-dependent oxidoreductase n=1 Tax=Streptomyces sp. TLI_55 TaxID=1938861 RepID=UPI000BCE49DA|nr:FAD-dependent oxidoreductase [Streptomyces sp. TLI_55]SNX66398.1 2-polyprenyl-6-methoxyphenol hydroxylase-like FAD-dependent oxidoreductase [Streptomyces sp. TLI_55]
MNNPQAIDVLIIGAGPSGSALAIDLVRRGLDVRIVDKSPHAFDGSRAKGIQPRSLEVLEDLGALDDVLAGGDNYPKLGLHAGPIGVPWRMFPEREATSDVPYPNTWLIPQFRTDRALHARLGELGREVEFCKELTELTQDADAVVAKVVGADGVEEIVTRYAVGADGGSSAVRKQLDIGFVGTTDEADRVLIVDASVSGLARNRWHMWPGRGGKLIAACPLPHSDMFQWMIRLTPDEKPPQEIGAIIDRIHSHTRNRHIQLHEIHWKSVFRPNIRLAQHYGRGRVFLVGDAAHVHTPAGAQGLNTGMQDGYNLGWKLGQVLAGADPALLDTYEAERQPIAAGVLGLSTEKWGGIAKLDPSSMKRGKDEQQLSLTYYGGPLARANSGDTSTLHVGDRAPDARLLGADGAETRLFHLFQGPHFTAIAYGPGAARDLDLLHWPTTGAQLKRLTVGPPAGFSDPGNTLRSAYGLTGDTLLLIRPDGYIGHIATSDFLTTTQAAVRAMTPEARSRAMFQPSHTSCGSGAAE